MWRRVILGILLAALLVAGGVGIGLTAYNYGVARGLVDSGRVAVEGGRFVGPHFYGAPFFGRPFGFGFGFLGCLIPVLFFFLLFGLFRFIFWRPWGWGHRGHWGGPWMHGEGKGVPPMFEEWHKRAHGEQAAPPPESPQG
jgi:hypothetical protein